MELYPCYFFGVAVDAVTHARLTTIWAAVQTAHFGAEWAPADPHEMHDPRHALAAVEAVWRERCAFPSGKLERVPDDADETLADLGNCELGQWLFGLGVLHFPAAAQSLPERFAEQAQWFWWVECG